MEPLMIKIAIAQEHNDYFNDAGFIGGADQVKFRSCS